MSVQAPLQRDADLREQNEQLKTALDKAAIDIGNLQTQLTAALRQNTYLERQVAKANRKEVPQSDVIEVFEHYLALVWSGKGRRPALDAAKEKLIRGRLRDRSVADLRLAVAGLAKRPNVGDKGRCGPGEGRRFADLKHALRDDDTVLRFIGYAEGEEPSPERAVSKRRSEFREVEPRSGEEFVDALVDLGSSVIRRHGYGAQSRWMAQCPAHDDRTPSLSITENADGSLILFCFAGCTGGGIERNDPSPVLDAMGWSLPMIRGKS